MRAGILLAVVAVAGAARADVIKNLEPVAISLRPPRMTTLRTLVLKVRVYAASDYGVQTVNAEAHIHGLLDRINAKMQPWPGVRFQVESFHRWPADSAHLPIDKLLASLVDLDGGGDVDLVVGMASALPVFSGNLDTLGMARLFGRHAILRGLDDLQEYAAIKEILSTTTKGTAAREALVSDRRAHKEEVLFLHEWAHALGALHVDDEHDLMNPRYDTRQEYFAPINTRVIESFLKRRAEAATNPRWRDAARADLLALAESAPQSWTTGERELLLAQLGGAPAHDKPPIGQGVLAKKSLSSDERMLLDQAVDTFRAGDAKAALALIDRLAMRLPDDETVQWNWCGMLHQAGDARAEAVCGRYAGINPHDPFSPLVVATARWKAHDAPRAREALAIAQQRLEQSPPGDPHYWNWLAGAWLAARLPSLAERAAAHAPAEAAAKLRRSIELLRRRAALPAGSDLPPEREFEYIDDLERAEFSLSSGKWKVAEQLVAEIERRYPKLPAGPLLRCRLDLEAHRSDAAEKQCRAAIALDGDATLAWFNLGDLLFRRKQWKPAAAALRKTVALDPEMETAWRALEQILQQAHDHAGLEAVRAEHQKQLADRPAPPSK